MLTKNVSAAKGTYSRTLLAVCAMSLCGAQPILADATHILAQPAEMIETAERIDFVGQNSLAEEGVERIRTGSTQYAASVGFGPLLARSRRAGSASAGDLALARRPLATERGYSEPEDRGFRRYNFLHFWRAFILRRGCANLSLYLDCNPNRQWYAPFFAAIPKPALHTASRACRCRGLAT